MRYLIENKGGKSVAIREHGNITIIGPGQSGQVQPVHPDADAEGVLTFEKQKVLLALNCLVKTLDGHEDTPEPKTDRDELKARAEELELSFAKNITTAKLAELVANAEAKAEGNANPPDQAPANENETTADEADPSTSVTSGTE